MTHVFVSGKGCNEITVEPLKNSFKFGKKKEEKLIVQKLTDEVNLALDIKVFTAVLFKIRTCIQSFFLEIEALKIFFKLSKIPLLHSKYLPSQQLLIVSL